MSSTPPCTGPGAASGASLVVTSGSGRAVIIPKKGLKREVEEEEEEESNSDSGSNEEGSEYEDSEDDSEADSRALKAAYREVTVLKQFPRHYYPELAKYLVDCPMMGCDDAASAFLRLYPGPGLKLTASAIRRIAVKEKRRGDTRLCWYIRPEVSELLDGVELDCEALLPSVDAAPKGKSDTRVKASKVVKEVRVGRREEKATPITVEVVKERKKPGRKPKQVVVSPRVPPQAVILSKAVPPTSAPKAKKARAIDTVPVPVVPQPSLPTASVLMVPDCKPRMFLGQYTEEVAVALCDVIVSALHLTLTGDDTAYMHPQAPTRIDWEKVADAVKGCTPLQSALECQRLWKYIAYGEDTGGKGPNLAPDTDSDDT